MSHSTDTKTSFATQLATRQALIGQGYLKIIARASQGLSPKTRARIAIALRDFQRRTRDSQLLAETVALEEDLEQALAAPLFVRSGGAS